MIIGTALALLALVVAVVVFVPGLRRSTDRIIPRERSLYGNPWDSKYRTILDTPIDINGPLTREGIEKRLTSMETELASRVQQMREILDEKHLIYDRCPHPR